MAIFYAGTVSENKATEVLTDHAASADSATVNDTNFPPANGIDCTGWKKVLVFVRFNAGTAPTVAFEPMLRCGSGWVKLAATAALGEGVAAIVETHGRLMYLRANAATGTPTNYDVFVAGYEAMVPDTIKRS